MRRARRVAVALAFLLALWPAAATAATASAPGGGLTVREVDTTSYPEVTVSVLSTGPRPDLADFTVRENGRFVHDVEVVPIAETATPVGIVLAVDTSGSMAANDALGQAKGAAREFILRRGPHERIALVTFGTSPRVVRSFTDDRDRLLADVDQLALEQETALWDGLVTSVELLRGSPELQPNVVVLSDGADTVSVRSQDEAVSSAKAVGAAVFVVGLQGGDFQDGPVRAVAEATGGTYLATADPQALGALYGEVQATLQNQFEVRFRSEAGGGALELAVGTGTAQARAQANPGTVAVGEQAQPRVVEPAGGRPLTGDEAKWLAVLLAGLAASAAGWAVASLVAGGRSPLERALEPYAGVVTSGPGDEPGGPPALAQSALVQRAVAATESFAERQGLLERTARLLEEADVALRPSEALFFHVSGTLVASLLAGALGRSPLLFGLALLVAGVGPPAALHALAARRKRRFVAQLPDMLQLLAGSLRAGYSLMQGVDTVSREVDGPMGQELRRIVTEAQLGRPLEQALDDAAERVGSADFSWAVMAICIQREVGGNLAELLLTVADTMVERQRLRREVKALTAEGRMSAIVLGVMPPGLAGAIYVLNPDYVMVLFTETVGKVMLGVAALMMVGGLAWMKKVIEVDV